MLLWLPYGMASGQWPGGGPWVTALLAIPLAYVAGHLLQSRSNHVFPSTVKDSKGSSRFPSDVLLDSDDKEFTAEFKEELAARMLRALKIDVRGDASTKRKDAFFLCRSVLIGGKTYGEQFEGLYALMRGLAAAFLLASAYYAGWALAALKYDCLFVASDILLIAGLAAAIFTSFPLPRLETPVCARFSFCSFLLALLSGGYLLGRSQPATQDLWGRFIVMMLIAILFAMKCFGAFKLFTLEFAKAIYRDFYAYEPKKPESKAEEK